MTNLLVIKEYVKSFYARYEEFILPILKFLLGLTVFLTINNKLGYMESLKKLPIVLIVSLLCAILPLPVMAFLAAVFILLHVFTLSMECAAVLLVVFLMILVVYFRFSPKDSLILMVTPLLFSCKIPYVVPLTAGLLAGPFSAVPTACGVIVYYALSYISTNAAQLGASETESLLTGLRDMAVGIVMNKEMFVTAAAFAITVILVYTVRRLSIDYAPMIAIVAGALGNIVILLVGDLMFETNISILGLIFGSVISALFALAVLFFRFNLDYARTEKVQFEDDEYYYYVKAVPKMTVAAPEKKIKKITTQRGDQSVRHSNGKGKAKPKN